MAYYTTGIGAMFGTIVDGTTTITAAGTPVRLTETPTPCAGVYFTGDSGNGGIIFAGTLTVDGVEGQQRGIAAEPAGNSHFIPVNDASLVYFDANVNGDKVAWAYLQP